MKLGFAGPNVINNLIVMLINFSACKCLYVNFLCAGRLWLVWLWWMFIAVDIYYFIVVTILFYYSRYIILLCYLYYFIVLKVKIDPLILDFL